MDIQFAEKILDQEFFDNIDRVIEYDEVGIYQGMNGCIEYIKQLTGCDDTIAKQLIDKYKELQPSGESIRVYEARVAKANAEALDLFVNKPKCPTCGSTNIKKISDFTQLSDTFAFQGHYKQFRCKNCGYKW